MTRIGFIRHGSTAWNKAGRAQGHTNIPLDAEGLNQAQRLAERLSKEKWDVIYSSDLTRTRQTAEAVHKKLGDKPIFFDERLREAGGGLIEGTTEAERIEKWGSDWRNLDLKRETKEDVEARGLPAIEEMLKKHPDQNILIVSHGAFNRHLLNKLVPVKDGHGPLNNTSVTKILLTADKWDCELFNCTHHLEAVLKAE